MKVQQKQFMIDNNGNFVKLWYLKKVPITYATATFPYLAGDICYRCAFNLGSQ